MRKLILFSIFSFLILSCSKKREEIKESPPTNSILILKAFNPTDKLIVSENSEIRLLINPVGIIDPTITIEKTVYSFNNISDTIIIKHSNPVMLAGVNYSPLIRNTYYFRAGDTLVVDFSDLKNIKEYYLNKNVLLGDIPPITIIDTLEYQSKYFTFDKEAIKKNKEEDSLHYVLSEKQLDSLYKTKQIYEPFYKIRKQKFEYTKKTKNFNIDNQIYLKKDSLIGLGVYQYFLQEFTKKKFNIKTIKSTNAFFFDYKTAFDSVYQSDIYGKKAKDYLMFHYLDQMTQDFSYNDFKERFDKFKEVTKDTGLVTFLEDKYLLNFTDLKKETQEIYFINPQKKKQTLSQILEDNKGKVIYVDFWASWCAPCRSLMPASRELHKQYKDVVFLYLSIDNDFEKWQKANRDEGLSQNRFSLLAVNYPNADFYKELNLRSIPRYLLYDKQGNLVHKNAPNPDSDIIKQELDKLLQ